jgi:glutamate/tyrosine decarboxylase-like PLP-dependent enzyme
MKQNGTLTLSGEDMRALGYRVVDLLVQHFEELPRKPVSRKADRATLEARLREPTPEHGMGPLEVLDQVQRDVLSNIMHTDHPRFFAFVPSPSNLVGVMADALASGFNVFAGTWLEASGPAQIELVTIDWLRQAYGFAMVSSTVLRGNTVCTINPRTTEDDLRATIKRLDEIGKKWRPL